MRDFAITAIVLGALALAAGPFTPEGWELSRWGMALWMLGGPALGATIWIASQADKLRTPPADSEPGA